MYCQRTTLQQMRTLTPLHGELTSADFVAQVQRQHQDNDEEDDEDDGIHTEQPVVTIVEAEQCLKKLQWFFEAEEDASRFFSSINDMDCYLDKETYLPAEKNYRLFLGKKDSHSYFFYY